MVLQVNKNITIKSFCRPSRQTNRSVGWREDEGRKEGCDITRNQIALSEHLENVRHNSVTETETQRHNVQDEAVRRYAAGASYASVAEQRRHNLEQEAMGWVTTQSTAMLQGVQGEVAQYNAITNRLVSVANAKSQRIQARATKAGVQETVRHNLSTEAIQSQDADTRRRQQEEAARHNKVLEAQGWVSVATGAYKDIVGTTTRGFRDVVAGGTDIYDTIQSGGMKYGPQTGP